MHIGIDGNEANVSEKVGIGEYAYQLIKLLSNYQDKHKFSIFLKDKPKDSLPPQAENWKYIVTLPKPLWTQFALPIRLYTTKLDLFFSPNHYAPRFCPVPSVISIMDLSYIYFPKLFKKTDLIKLKNWTENSVRNAAKIITIRNYSRDSIIKYYKVDPDKINVTYPGYNNLVYKQYISSDVEKIKRKYGLDNYLIFVGTIQPRKNLMSLIAAYSDLLRKYPNLQLVIIGKKGWMYEDFFKKITDPVYKNKIIYLGYVDMIEIGKLYNGAACFVLPSFYEGFGLTVIEAMASGCPVCLSNVTSLPEIAGDWGSYFNPNYNESIKKAIDKIISPDQKYYRKKLIKGGIGWVSRFSWNKCANDTLSVFERLVYRV